MPSLEATLTALYPDEASSRRLVDRAGIPAHLVRFYEPAAVRIHHIITEASHQGMTRQLLEAALDDYPDHPDLRAYYALLSSRME